MSRSFVLAACVMFLPVAAGASQIYGAPDPIWGIKSYKFPSMPIYGGNAVIDGMAVGVAQQRSATDQNLGNRAFRWDASGNVLELPSSSGGVDGARQSHAVFLHPNGTITGSVGSYDETGTYLGTRAARWNAAGALTELPSLGTDPSDWTQSVAMALNANGLTVGMAGSFNTVGQYKGMRPVRWDADGVIHAMQMLGTDATGYASYNVVRSMNAAGFSVGVSTRYRSTGEAPLASRWSPTGEITELGGLHSLFWGESDCFSINSSNVCVGLAPAFADIGTFLGEVPVRWDAAGVAHRLQTLGDGLEGVAGKTAGHALSINDAGESAGAAYKFDILSQNLGFRPMKWRADDSVIELAILGTDSNGAAEGEARAINSSGQSAGWVQQYDSSGHAMGQRAMFWDADGTGIVLNNLLPPNSGWVNLTQAFDISDGGWIAGVGQFDPDGVGGMAAYDKMFLLQVPEPQAVSMLSVILSFSGQRRRTRKHVNVIAEGR